MLVTKYPDGTSYVKEVDFSSEIIFRLNTYEDLWHLIQYVDVCNHNGYKPTITIPCLLDAQADRRFNKNESSGLKLVCKFLNNMNANFKIFHPHNSEVIEALLDNVEIIDNSEFIQQVLNIHLNMRLNEKVKENLILMSSDAGGFKPLMKLCDKIKWQGGTFSASKSRKYENGKSKLIQQIDRQDFQGKDILLIDDCLIYGNSAKGISKLLKERNCGKLYLAVSHMTVQNLGEDPVTNYFNKVFTTNSKYDKYYESLQGVKLNIGVPKDKESNLEIIKLF